MPTQIYRLKDGTRVPGASTVAKIISDPGGLLYWANKQGLEGRTLQDARKGAADAGTLAHAMVEAHLQGEDPQALLDGQPVETATGAETAFGAFLDWRESQTFEPITTEAAFVSETYRFGGTIDAVGLTSGGKVTLCDWKTGKAYEEHLLQLSGYRQLYEENTGDKIERVILAIFSKDSGLMAPITIPLAALDEAFDAFVHAKALYDARARLRKVLP